MDKSEKRPFNKKAWRDKKYGHSHKVDEWKKEHRFAAKMKYKRMLKKEQKNNPNFVPTIKDNNASDHNIKADSRKTAFSKAKEKFNEKVAQKQQKQEEFLRRQEEKNEAVKKYKEKKAARLKVLNAKTKRGQPKMGGRIELLLAKIEEQCAND